MKLRWLGHSCFEIELDNGKVIVTDPYDDTVGYPPLHVRADCVLSSHGHFDHNYFAAVEGEPEILTQPGAYEVCGAKITGVPSWHDDAQGAKRGGNVIFSIEADGLKLTHLEGLASQAPETREGRFFLTAESFQIPKSVQARRVRLETEEETFALNLDEDWMPTRPPITTIPSRSCCTVC